MTIETALVTALTPLAATTPFDKANPATRPRITYRRIAGVYHESFSGEGPGRIRLQVDIWADEFSQARVLAEQAKVALRAGLTVGTITDNPDDYEPDTKLNRASFDVAAWI